jgi:energy-coupling factor transporter ATP-binding protein EcfA2
MKLIHQDIKAAGRGGFQILRGDSGSGKSTFLNTLDMFLERVNINSILRDREIESALRQMGSTAAELRVVVIEGRDALREVRPKELEAAIHEINSFIRSSNGDRTLIVWPVNADDLEDALVSTCKRVGGDSLLGVDDPSYRFFGPPKTQYLDIASRTVATLNQGASLSDLGVSEERASELTAQAPTIGHFLGLLRKDLVRNQGNVESLLEKERCRLWIAVVAANDPEGDVAGLTRGTASAADIGRLMVATKANIVQDLRKFPEKLGILGAVLDAKILHLPSVTALAIARDFADDDLSAAMGSRGLSVIGKGDAIDRLNDSDLGRAFSGSTMGPRTRGPKAGSNTVDAFRKLSDIASQNDQLLNAAVGRALQAAALITDFKTEKDIGSGLTRYTDVLCDASIGSTRLEFMWRSKAGRADIANYTLMKLYNYGRAIGFLD